VYSFTLIAYITSKPKQGRWQYKSMIRPVREWPVIPRKDERIDLGKDMEEFVVEEVHHVLETGDIYLVVGENTATEEDDDTLDSWIKFWEKQGFQKHEFS
jgi:hypothetical protein